MVVTSVDFTVELFATVIILLLFLVLLANNKTLIRLLSPRFQSNAHNWLNITAMAPFFKLSYANANMPYLNSNAEIVRDT